MTLFYLFLKRDFKQLFFNPRLIILPFGFFCTSLFLVKFMSGNPEPLPPENLANPLYWIFFILSTAGVVGQTIARDHDLNFLEALKLEPSCLTPYIIAKALTLSLAWTIPFWLFLEGIQLVEGATTFLRSLQSCSIMLSVSVALSFLYCLLDALFCKAQRSSMLSLILLTPFILPLLILSFLSLEHNTLGAFIPLASYALFISLSAFLLTKSVIES